MRAGEALNSAIILHQVGCADLGNGVIAVRLKPREFAGAGAVEAIFRGTARLHERVTSRVEQSLDQVESAGIVDCMNLIRCALPLVCAVGGKIEDGPGLMLENRSRYVALLRDVARNGISVGRVQ